MRGTKRIGKLDARNGSLRHLNYRASDEYRKKLFEKILLNELRSELASCGEKMKSQPTGLVIVSSGFSFVAYSS